MSKNQVQIKVPLKLQDELLCARRIFLSVNPIAAFSDVLLALDKIFKDSKTEFDISSISKLHEIDTSNCSSLIIACGDMPLKEIPSYLRGLAVQHKISGRGDDLSHAPWLVLRAHISNNQNHLFEYLSSSEIDHPCPSLLDTSWSDFALLTRRFEKAKKISGTDVEGRQSIFPDTSKRVVGGDLEFLE